MYGNIYYFVLKLDNTFTSKLNKSKISVYMLTFIMVSTQTKHFVKYGIMKILSNSSILIKIHLTSK